MVISWTPSGAVVTVPTPGPGVAVAAEDAGEPPPHPARPTVRRTTAATGAALVQGPAASVRAVGGTRVLFIAGAPYAPEGRRAADRRQSARTCRPRRPRPGTPAGLR